MQKRIVWGVLLVMLVQILAFGLPAYADELPITIWINGEKVETDVDPVMESDRTLVPLRAIFEALGAEVTWDDASQTATVQMDGITIQAVVDQTVMKKNGEDVVLDVPARLINDRTMVPVRAISEGLGAAVEWDEAEQRVLITYQKTEEPAQTEAPAAIGERVQKEDLEGYQVVWYDDVEMERNLIKDEEGNITTVEMKDKNGKLLGKAIDPATGKEISIAAILYTADGVNVGLTDEDEKLLKEGKSYLQTMFLTQYYFDIKENETTVYQALDNNAEAIQDFTEESWDTAFITMVMGIQATSDYKYLTDVESEKELLAYFKEIQQKAEMEAGDIFTLTTGDLSSSYRMIFIEFIDGAKNDGDIHYILCAFDKDGNIRYFALQNIGDGRFGIIEIDENAIKNYYICEDLEADFQSAVETILRRNVLPAGVITIITDEEENAAA